MSSPVSPCHGAAAAREIGLEYHRIRLVLFDLDGTLVDSLGDLHWSGNEMLRELGLPARTRQDALTWVGNGVERLVKRFLGGDMQAEPDAELFRDALQRFNRIYADNLSVHSDVYPGVRECLQRLSGSGLHLGCVTNKPERFARRLLELLALDGRFDLVVGGDTTPRQKPDPMPLRYAAEYFGLECSECLMVGDSSNDVKAARNAGFGVIAVPYGYNHGQDIRESNPDRVVENLVELVDLLIEEKPE